ncbi:hypothetical protein [Pseudoxanthomonas mexicana]|uniref:hypothetical protein n=1 Tax=Pseudoxanthomonas mexicana TaxID=128785 RepID=UPI00398B4DFA
MDAGVQLSRLFDDLDDMHQALRADDLDRLQSLMTQHDWGVRCFMEAEGHRADPAELARLLAGQQDLQKAMERARHAASRQLHASQKAGRASRAYLSVVGD